MTIDDLKLSLNRWHATRQAEQEKDLAERRRLRGQGICAHCKRPVYGVLDYPDAEACTGFFGGALEPGDGICWWCLDNWSVEPEDQVPHARA
jgi:hypothetical protein